MGNQLLHSLRTRGVPYEGDILGIPCLDRLLDVFVDPSPPTLIEEQAYTQWEPSYSRPQHEKKKSTKAPVIEITGASPCSGKTQLLYYAAAISLLPVTYKDVSIQGKGGAVVWIDTDGRLDILRLRDIMMTHVSSCLDHSGDQVSELQEGLDKEYLETSLQHLHIFRPQSSAALLKTLESISAYLFDNHRHYSNARRLQAVIFDGLSAFLWQDRMEKDNDLGGDYQRNDTFVQRYRLVVDRLRDLQNTFECVIIASSWSLSPLGMASARPTMRPHIPAVWNNFCALRIIVARDGVTKFGPGISAEEALLEGPKRLEAVQKRTFTGQINHWGSDEWRDDILESLRSLGKNVAFSFRVTEHGVKLFDTEDGKH